MHWIFVWCLNCSILIIIIAVRYLSIFFKSSYLYVCFDGFFLFAFSRFSSMGKFKLEKRLKRNKELLRAKTTLWYWRGKVQHSLGLDDNLWPRFSDLFRCWENLIAFSVLKAAPTEILTFEVGRSPCGRLPENHNGYLNTGKSGLSAEILPWTQSRAWPFWCPPRQLTLLIWHAMSGLA